jgi:outer membrane protein OmpA-like peptidoglycan-associated protein
MTLYRLPRWLWNAAAVTLVTTCATGCTAVLPSDPSGGLAIVLGARGNTPEAELLGMARQVALNAVDTRSPVSVVVADGAPFVVGADRSAPSGGAASDDAPSGARAATAEIDDRDALERAVTTAAARSPESDLLGALGLAAQELDGAPGRPTLLVVDSGLSTTGALDFRRPGLLNADPDDLAESLAQSGQLPDLSGLHVVFQGLGETAPPQPALGAVAREKLVDTWTAITRAAGAMEVIIERGSSARAPSEDLPPVSVVGEAAGISCRENSLVLDGGDVSFLADSARFRDPAAASAVLEPIAQRIRSVGASAVLTGTTADVGNLQGQKQLSLQRAQAVADLLAALGVSEQRMSVEGLGSDFPGYVRDHDGQGDLLPAAAAMNRKVTISLSGSARTVLCS